MATQLNQNTAELQAILDAVNELPQPAYEEWELTLDDGSTVTKVVYVK